MIVVLCAAACITACPSQAQAEVIPPATSLPSKHELKELVLPFARRFKGAVVVGVVNRDGQVVAAFGRDRSGHAAGADTVFETASVSKVFCALLLSKAVLEGSVFLNEPVDRLLGSWRLPHWGSEPITLSQLAEHSSGLPAWPSNRGSTASAYSKAELRTYLAHARLEFPPGQDNLYSNTGFALLGDALAHRAGTGFNELLQKEICGPLSMSSTRVGLSAQMRKRLAGGHDASGLPMRQSAPTAGGGADGVNSTCADLLRLTAACAGAAASPLAGAAQLACTPRQSVDDDNDIGLGFYKRKADGIIWKAGCLAGYRTYIGFLPEKHLGVVVLAGCNAFPAPQLGCKLLHRLTEAKGKVVASVSAQAK